MVEGASVCFKEHDGNSPVFRKEIKREADYICKNIDKFERTNAIDNVKFSAAPSIALEQNLTDLKYYLYEQVPKFEETYKCKITSFREILNHNPHYPRQSEHEMNWLEEKEWINNKPPNKSVPGINSY